MLRSRKCERDSQTMPMFLLLSLLISASLARGQWGDKVGRERERVDSLRRGDGTYNPKSAWMFVDSRRRVLPDIDGRDCSVVASVM